MSRRAIVSLATVLIPLGLPTAAVAYELDEIPITEWPLELDPDPVTPERYHQRVPVPGPLAITYLDRLEPVATTRAEAERGRVLLLVNSDLVDDLSEALDTYAEDLALEKWWNPLPAPELAEAAG